MTLEFRPNTTVESLSAMIDEVAAHEVRSKALIGEAVRETLAHVLTHGNIKIATKLAQALTPANRTALVLLFRETTAFGYDLKSKEFGKKEKVTADQLEEKEKALTAFVNKYQGDVWAWYEATKEKPMLAPKFSKAALIKQMANYLGANNLSNFDETFASILAEAQAEAVKGNQLEIMYRERMAELKAANPEIDEKAARAFVEAEYKAGILKPKAANAEQAEQVQAA